mmetsp:Transcript_44148/g.44676  ORF Transcript_44148/g.44676 Transcript_44148/m.44676 type:complete len:86 (+) Transcript_44148:137-394(+)
MFPVSKFGFQTHQWKKRMQGQPAKKVHKPKKIIWRQLSKTVPTKGFHNQTQMKTHHFLVFFLWVSLGVAKTNVCICVTPLGGCRK